MNPDYNAQHAQWETIQTCANNALSRIPEGTTASSDQIARAFAELTPPIEPDIRLELITVHSLQSPRAISRKPGNIILSWRNLLDVTAEMAITSAGATALPMWLYPAVGLALWNQLVRGTEEHFSDVEASTIIALWKGRNSANEISEDKGYAKTVELRQSLKLPQLSRNEYTVVINRFLAMNCVELNSGIIRLREKVRIKY